MIKEFLQFKAREAFLLGIRQAQELTESLQAREDNIKHIRTVSFFFFCLLNLLSCMLPVLSLLLLIYIYSSCSPVL